MTQFISKKIKGFTGDKKGVTMLEYGLIAALVAVVAMAGFTALGKNVLTQINAIATAIGGA